MKSVKCSRCKAVYYGKSCDCKLFSVIDEFKGKYHFFAKNAEGALYRYAEELNEEFIESGGEGLWSCPIVVSVGKKNYKITAKQQLIYSIEEIETTKNEG